MASTSKVMFEGKGGWITFAHANNIVQECQVPVTSNNRMKNKCDICDFTHGIVVGTRWSGLSISETVDLPGFSYTQDSLEFARML